MSATAWHSEPCPGQGAAPKLTSQGDAPAAADGHQQRAAMATTEDTAPRRTLPPLPRTGRPCLLLCCPVLKPRPETRNGRGHGGRAQVTGELLTPRWVLERAPGGGGSPLPGAFGPCGTRGTAGTNGGRKHEQAQPQGDSRHHIAGRRPSPPPTRAPSREREPTGTVSSAPGPERASSRGNLTRSLTSATQSQRL